MSRRKNMALMLTGTVLGASLVGGAAAAGVIAEPTWQKLYVDGEQVSMTAYNIAGNNYVKLRDIGKEVGFNVYWDNGVQINSDADYTGEKPVQMTATPVASAADDLSANMDIRMEIVRRINQVRRENGVFALPVNQSLMNAAQDYSTGMYTSHKNRLECETVLAYGYPHGFRSNLTVFTGIGLDKAAEKAVANWVKSSGHFETMIDPSVDSIGVGVTTDGVKVCCYMFAGASHAYNPYAP